jgi:hypothetical protein
MEESTRKVPTLTKLGKLANAKKFEELEDAWPTAVAYPEYAASDLLRIAGQVSRQGDPERADGMLAVMLGHIEETRGAEVALAAARQAARQLPHSTDLRDRVRELYAGVNADFAELPGLLDRLLADERPLDAAVELIDAYIALRPGAYAADHAFVIPGRVERVQPDNGVLTVLFDERHAEYGPETVAKLHPLPDDHFAALVIYAP